MVKGLAMHEVGVHYGFEAMLGADKQTGHETAGPDAQVRQRGGAGGLRPGQSQRGAAQPCEETLAYLVQNNPENSVIRTSLPASRRGCSMNSASAGST